MGEVELKVLLYIMRRTYGFKKRSDEISINQIVDGIVKADGERLDMGAGVSHRGAIEGVKKLEARGVIIVRRNTGPDGRLLPSTYALRRYADPSGSSRNWVGY